MTVRELTFIAETVSTGWDWAFFKKQMEKQDRVTDVLKARRPLTRAPNACIPCRKSKTKCDHAFPSCTSCTKKRDKTSQNQCVYANPPKKRRGMSPSSESETDTDSDETDEEHDNANDAELERPPHRGPPCVVKDEQLFGPHAMARSIEQFKELAGGKDLCARHPSAAQCSGREAFETTTTASVNVAAVEDDFESPPNMAPLCPYSLPQDLVNSMPPYLKNLYSEAIRVQRLVLMGKLMKAWIDMPRLVRLAQLDRLDHNQGTMTPPPETREKEFRLRVWWLILDLDIQISMHIGRPLAVRAKLGIDRPTLDGVDGIYKQLEQSRLDFKQYALEVLADICIEVDQDGSHRQDVNIELPKLDRLQSMEKRLPQLPNDAESDEQLIVALADHKIELLALKMMLCCIMAANTQKQQQGFSKIAFQKDALVGQAKGGGKKIGRPRRSPRDDTYNSILQAARSILETFDIVAKIDNYGQYSNWNRYFDAYCAAAILAVAALQNEKRPPADDEIINRASETFNATHRKYPHCHIANVAATRMEELKSSLLIKTEGTRVWRPAKPHPAQKQRQGRERGADETTPPPKKRKTDQFDQAPSATDKRRRLGNVSAAEHPRERDDYTENSLHYHFNRSDMSASQVPDLDLDVDNHVDSTMGFVPNSPADLRTNTSVSFDGSMPAPHYSPHLTYSVQAYEGTHLEIPWNWYHPPLAHPQVPLLDVNEWNLPPAITMQDQHSQSSASYGIGPNAEQTRQPNPLATFEAVPEHEQYLAQGPPAVSIPNTPYHASVAHYLPDQHTPLPQQPQLPRHHEPTITHQQPLSSIQESQPWEWTQNPQYLMRRNSAMAAQIHSNTNNPTYYSPFEIHTTNGAWK